MLPKKIKCIYIYAYILFHRLRRRPNIASSLALTSCLLRSGSIDEVDDALRNHNLMSLVVRI